MNNKKTIIGILIFVAVLYGLSRLPLADYLNAMIQWFRGFGIWAPIVYYIFFALTSSWMFPVFMLSICGGILFGPWVGLLVITAGNLTSFVIMFLLARFTAKEWFAEKFSNHQKVQALLKVVEAEGWRMIFMLRAVPIVHTIVLNISCGISSVKVKDFVIGSVLGVLPLLGIYVYIGTLTDSVISSSSDMEFNKTQSMVFMAIAVVILVAFSAYMRKVMKRHMAENKVALQ